MTVVFKAVLLWMLSVQLYRTNASVWLEGPSIAYCRETVRLSCHYCDTPLTNWTWSRKNEQHPITGWRMMFQNGSKIVPTMQPVVEEINGTISLVFIDVREVEGSWKCGVGNQESKPVTIQKYCTPSLIMFFPRRTSYNVYQPVVQINSLWPIPKHINLTIELPPFKPVLVPASYHGCTGFSWALDCTWFVKVGLVSGNYSYRVEVTTLITTVLTGQFELS